MGVRAVEMWQHPLEAEVEAEVDAEASSQRWVRVNVTFSVQRGRGFGM